MTAPNVRPWLLAILVACSGGPSIPPDEPAPPLDQDPHHGSISPERPDTRPDTGPPSASGDQPGGQGWYCFTMIHRNKRESAVDVSDCQRTIEECNYLRYDYDRSDEYDVTSCEFQPEAACFKAKHRPSGWIEDHCSGSMALCTARYQIMSGYPEQYDLVVGCTRTS